METRLSHHGKKTYGFQRNSFTTGVWSGDNQEVKIIPETDVNRNGFFLINQWMTGLAKPDPAFCVENRFTCVHVHGKCSTGKNKIQLYHDGKIRVNSLQLSSYLLA